MQYLGIKDASRDLIEGLAAECREHDPDVLVAIGGGKVLDATKVVSYLLNNPGKTFDDMKSDQSSNTPSIPLVAAPTTPGTGSETNSIAVVKDDSGRKIPIINQGFIPSLAILDHGFMETIPEPMLYEFGADIFAHGVEGSVSMAGTPLLAAMGDSCLELLKSGFGMLKEKPGNPKGLARILYAGHLGGIVQGNAFVGVVHALAHALDLQVKISHAGAILAVMKPTIEWLNQQKPRPEYKRYLEIYDAIGFEAYRNTEILKNVDLDKWNEDALADSSISTTPVRMKKENLGELIEWILQRS